jgi:2-aminobenzoylacetyl-CoA thioesterase
MTASDRESNEFPRLLADNLWVVGNYYFNLYLVKGEQAAALIEVGVSAVVDDVVRQLDSLKIRPTFMVVTHPHADHVTGLPGLRERFPNDLVVAGEGTAEFLAHPKVAPALIIEDRHISDYLAAKGVTPGRPPLEELPSLENSLIARDGDHMDLGGRTLRFLTVKGHSPGKIIVYVPEIKTLILSDSLGLRFPGRGVFPLFFTSYRDFIGTLDRLEGLDLEVVGVAHQGPIVGKESIRKAFKESRQEAEELRDEIVRDSRDPEEIAKDVFDRYYRDECTIYTRENIMSCARLIVKRAREQS